jgi:hypothetical protein
LSTVAALPEKTERCATNRKSPQDKALVAKPGSFPENIQINYKLTGRERGDRLLRFWLLEVASQACMAVPLETMRLNCASERSWLGVEFGEAKVFWPTTA